VGLEIERVKIRLADRDIGIVVTDQAKEWLAVKGFDPCYGARPVKRTIQREVETPLSKILLAGLVKAQNGNTIVIHAGIVCLSYTSFSQIYARHEFKYLHFKPEIGSKNLNFSVEDSDGNQTTVGII
jgi:hypothetical protein